MKIESLREVRSNFSEVIEGLKKTGPVIELYPDPVDLPSRGYDVHDRRSAGQAIIRKLRPAE
ncbi:MAG: hypothetical protein IT165_35345 [Bryobacterales bacterium]|nr:hypothetical protein [Bryobacterales bacterium]